MRHLLLASLLAGVALPAAAQVIRFEVLETVPAFEGRAFDATGPYVRITGRATIAVDPADPRNAVIADIDRAPRNAAGRVEAVADVVLLRPADPARGNGTLLVDVPNRGRKLAPQLFDDSAQPGANRATQAADAGIGFLHRAGTSMAWIGWQADIPSAPGQLALAAPALAGVTGPSREEFLFDHTRSPATAALAWPMADPANLTVTVRAHWADPRQTPPGLAIRATGPQQVEITRPATGFDAAALYEVTYTARDPIVLGLGYAATRDVAAFLRREGGPQNPLAAAGRPTIHRAIGFGVSQSGRFLRDFLWMGFNEDTSGRVVFDGLMPHIAGARRMATNVRFGQAGRNARHPQDPAWQADLFPFTYVTLDDELSGRRDGLMLRCRLNSTCPKVMQTDSEHEWWASRGSLLVTDPAGNHLDLPADVRAYMIAGTPHYADPGEAMRRTPTMALPVNPMHAGPPMRALLTAMEAWITEGTAPPASRVPMRAHGTLVAPAGAVPADIPGLPYAGLHAFAAFSDQAVFPPREIGRYPVFVPLADTDGMAVAGIRMLPLAVPRATYTGWNPRAEGFGAGTLFPLQGAVAPFAATRAAREAARDPRPSIEERYADNAAYIAAVRTAAARMVAERLLLPEDATRAADRAVAGSLAQLGQ
ncbi:alpha/beta hydrolase domain-containing protein [Humitalea sp. 24SJ18S-53]|uniref:alpha/beta hydrolase domain-containing protein n=1 Tax=Humitalea sp. 24SJ18S-53 TaxID=3422307 RepID=UPI003D664AC7